MARSGTALIGSGYRTNAFVRIAVRMPDGFALEGVVTRTEEPAHEIVGTWSVPGYTSLEALLDKHPVGFAITSTPFAVTPVTIDKLVGRRASVGTA